MSKNPEFNNQSQVITTFELFLQLAHTALQYSDSSFSSINSLTTARFITLKLINLNGGKITNSELADRINAKRSNITDIIKRMKKEKLVETERCQTDNRFIDIRITDKGQTLLEEGIPVASQIIKTIMHGISERQILELDSCLKKMKANIKKKRRGKVKIR